MLPRFAAFVIWAAVAASLVFWALRLGSRPLAAPAQAVVVSAAGGFNGDPSRVLGVDAAPPIMPSAEAPVQADPRFRLVGVVAPRVVGAGAGVALIATDGRPAKAYRVGAVVDGELVLLAVHSRGAALGPRGQAAQVDLQLPALPPPATGTLPRPAVTMPPLPSRPPQAPATQPMAPLPMAPLRQDNPDIEEPPEPASRPMPSTSPGVLRPPTVPGMVRPPT